LLGLRHDERIEDPGAGLKKLRGEKYLAGRLGELPELKKQ
jgi:hypothetical protein